MDTPTQANLIWYTLVHKWRKMGPEFWPTQRASISLGIATHLGSFDERWVAIDPYTKPIELDQESVCRLLASTSTVTILILLSQKAYTYFTMLQSGHCGRVICCSYWLCDSVCIVYLLCYAAVVDTVHLTQLNNILLSVVSWCKLLFTLCVSFLSVFVLYFPVQFCVMFAWSVSLDMFCNLLHSCHLARFVCRQLQVVAATTMTLMWV